MRWPGVIPPHQTCRKIVSAIDFFPTLAGLAGASIPSDRTLDGVDVWASITGKPNTDHPRKTLLYWHGKNGFHAIRSNQWKFFPGSGQLYNLSEDIGEKKDVSKNFPKQVTKLKTLAEAMVKEIESNVRPMGNIKTKNWRQIP